MEQPPIVKRTIVLFSHRFICLALQTLLERTDQFVISGSSSIAPEALEILGCRHPDLAIIDLDLGGVEMVRTICKCDAPPKLILLTEWLDEIAAMDALREGAQGYVLRTAGIGELLYAINIVLAGGTYITPGGTPPLKRKGAGLGLKIPKANYPGSGWGDEDEGCAGVVSAVLPRRPRQPPMAGKVPLPE